MYTQLQTVVSSVGIDRKPIRLSLSSKLSGIPILYFTNTNNINTNIILQPILYYNIGIPILYFNQYYTTIMEYQYYTSTNIILQYWNTNIILQPILYYNIGIPILYFNQYYTTILEYQYYTSTNTTVTSFQIVRNPLFLCSSLVTRLSFPPGITQPCTGSEIFIRW